MLLGDLIDGSGHSASAIEQGRECGTRWERGGPRMGPKGTDQPTPNGLPLHSRAEFHCAIEDPGGFRVAISSQSGNYADDALVAF